MLRENTFEEKFSVSALETLKTEILSLINVNVIPYEVTLTLINDLIL